MTLWHIMSHCDLLFNLFLLTYFLIIFFITIFINLFLRYIFANIFQPYLKNAKQLRKIFFSCIIYSLFFLFFLSLFFFFTFFSFISFVFFSMKINWKLYYKKFGFFRNLIFLFPVIAFPKFDNHFLMVNPTAWHPWFAFYFKVCTDVWFLLDLIQNFRTGWILEDGTVELHIPTIRKHYMKVWFWIDFISIIPFDTILEYAQSAGSKNALKWPKWPRENSGLPIFFIFQQL